MSAVITKQKYIKKILQKFKRIIHGGTNQAFLWELPQVLLARKSYIIIKL